ncbi:MAG TPA: CHAP domain-containing protein [Clostridia bacterium]
MNLNPDTMTPAELFSASSSPNTSFASQPQGVNPDTMTPQQIYQANQTPQDVTNAKQELGKHESAGWCENWAENMAGIGYQGSTAIDAFNNFSSKGKAFQGIQGVQPGDFLYFNGAGGLGHVGVVTQINPQNGEPTFISATDNGVESHSLTDWENYAGQQYLGYAKPYAQ